MEPEPSSPSSPPPAISGRSLTLTDLNADALAHCASFLSLSDVCNLAATCKPLRHVAYSDDIWRRLYAERWPFQCISSANDGAREKYLDRHIAVNQFKFSDPVRSMLSQHPIPYSHIMLEKNKVFVAQVASYSKLAEIGGCGSMGPFVESMGFESVKDGVSRVNLLTGHKARITCMRLFPIGGTSLFRSSVQDEEHVLVTSSSDRTIRIWWKGRSHRCLKGHNGPVTTLVDTLLGNCESKVLASGGEDCTVRLWSVGGKHHPIVTFHGHEKPVSLLSAAKHKASLLVSMSTDSRLRVWDTTLASSSGSSSCVGMVGFPGTPAGMECHETLCYVAAGSSVTAIDIRTMQKVCTIAVHPPKIHSFKMLPSKWLMCTGGEEKALLWDMRKNQAKPNPNAVAELEHGSLVSMLHMDSYKVVTGGPLDYHANIWETDTGLLANQLDCHFPGETQNYDGISAMGVYGSCIVTSGCYEEPGVLYFRDFSNCSVSLSSPDKDRSLKFWEPRNSSDSEDSDWEFEKS